MPQWNYPGAYPYSIYACERPYDQAPDLIKCEPHEPLRSDNHIRLLKVFPPGWPDRLTENLTREEDTDIQCEIYQVPLASITTEGRPYFATLSYAWGDPKPVRRIRCGINLITIPQSLYDALVYIRHSRTPRLLWIDCLCIDQNNSEEKSRQVQRMHLVYSASHCISWLGVENDPERDLTAMLPILRWFSDACRTLDDQDIPKDWLNVKHHFELNPLDGWSRLRELPWATLNRCLSRDIFSRLWCVQETLLARSNDLRTSVSHVNINVLVRSCHLLSTALTHEKRPGTINHNDLDRDLTRLKTCCFEIVRMLAGSPVNADTPLPRIENKRSAANQVASPAATATGLYRKECSDPRDRIYAIMALCSLDTSYQISYSKPAHQVFVDFTLQCLRDTCSLEIFQTLNRIAACRAESKYTPTPHHRYWLHGLPTWCPDFAGPRLRGRKLVASDHLRSEPLNACRERPACFTVLSRQLVGVLGVRVGAVKSCKHDWSGRNPGEDIADWTTEQVDASMRSCASSVQAVYSDGPLWKLYLDVCSAGADLHHSQAWSRLSEYLPARTRSRMVKSTIGAAWIMDYAPEFAPEGGLALSQNFDSYTWTKLATYVDAFMKSQSYGTRLFITDSPVAALGTGLDGTRVGDIVCVLFGSAVPLVLRKVGNQGHYKLIGECYVAGIMHGEALDMGLEEREFRLI
jgi:hypothetical protein